MAKRSAVLNYHKEDPNEWNTQDEVDYINSLASPDLINRYLRQAGKRVNWYNMNKHVILKHARKRARLLEP